MTDTVFHPGEHAAQAHAGAIRATAPIRAWMPDQHRAFFGLLPFLPVATAGAGGAPIATILTGSPGFISSPDPNTLHVAAQVDRHDPAAAYLLAGAPVGLLGIDLATRRRNRANGWVRTTDPDGLTIHVNQSFGNCPQYIQTRLWQDRPAAPGPAEHLTGLDSAARAMIAGADTFFVASSSGAGAGAMGGFDISHRGGRPGFVQIAGDTLTIPDFHGNGYFNTLGNLLLDPRVALLFVDWSDGTLLHIEGRADIRWNDAGGFPGAERIWGLTVTGGWRRPGAIPLRWSFQDYATQTMHTGLWPKAEEPVSRA